jgi:translation initiation factor 5B
MSATIRQPIVVVLGHVDSGKCIAGDTLLQLADGGILRAEEAFKRFRCGPGKSLPDGLVYESRGLRLLTLNEDGDLIPAEASHVWRLWADSTITVQTKGGLSIECTPEHRFLTVFSDGSVRYISASRLSLGDTLLIPKELKQRHTPLSWFSRYLAFNLLYSVRFTKGQNSRESRTPSKWSRNPFRRSISSSAHSGKSQTINLDRSSVANHYPLEVIDCEPPSSSSDATDSHSLQYTILKQTRNLHLDKVVLVKENRRMRYVYDFTVEPYHNFIANGFVVHNTSLLDRLRGTAVQVREAGGITQQIGASFFPPETLINICGPLLKMFGANIQVPGLLVIDTPGHEAFANLRIRGGSAADIAILVVDATKGIEAQTLESIDILRSRKVPFVVALTKIDLIAGWTPDPNTLVKDAAKRLQPATVELLDSAIYRVVGQLSQLGFASEAYYRVKDFTREVSIVPVSSKTGEGIAELLTIVVGLSQQYLAKRLKATGSRTRGIVLEVKEEPGLGPTINVILVDGVLRVGSKVVVAKRNAAQVVRVRALLLPKPLDEMRDPRDRFESVQEIAAAAGVKLSAPDLEGVLAGSPLLGLSEGEDEEEAKRQVMSEVRSAIFETEQLGVILKADTLGALEALSNLLKKQGTPVRIADIGPVTKRDVIQAASVKKDDRYLGVVLAFNVKVLDDAEQESIAKGVKIFNENVIYTLVDSYSNWVASEKENEARSTFSSVALPCKFRVLKGFVFRRNNPAVFGVEVLIGKLKQKSKVMNSRGEEVGSIQQIQHEGQDILEAQAGEKVAVSMKEPTVGRQIKEGEELYTLPESDHARLLLEKYMDRLSVEEAELLKEIVSTRRRVYASYAF